MSQIDERIKELKDKYTTYSGIYGLPAKNVIMLDINDVVDALEQTEERVISEICKTGKFDFKNGSCVNVLESGIFKQTIQDTEKDTMERCANEIEGVTSCLHLQELCRKWKKGVSAELLPKQQRSYFLDKLHGDGLPK